MYNIKGHKLGYYEDWQEVCCFVHETLKTNNIDIGEETTLFYGYNSVGWAKRIDKKTTEIYTMKNNSYYIYNEL